MKIGAKTEKTHFDFSQKTYIMGILNLTLDSFSDGGQFLDPGRALERALRMEEEGADLIDIGGESTRPGSEPVSEQVEIERVLPVLKKLIPALKTPISLDTQKAPVARIGLEEGVSMINDISALTGDAQMAGVVARAKVPVILMHKKGRPKTMQERVYYDDLMGEVTGFLADRVTAATAAGIDRDQILLDPGIGFGKSVEHNLEIIRRLGEIVKMGFPVVLGASRKSFIGKLLSKEPHERVEGGLGIAAIAAWNGAAIIRTHDVHQTHDVLRLVDALKQEEMRGSDSPALRLKDPPT